LSGRLKAGIAKVNITPPVGIDLIGFWGRKNPSRGIHDDLYSRALVLDDGEKEIALITADLLAVSSNFVASLREMVKERTGIAEKNILFATTHTHSGPSTDVPREDPPPDQAWLSILKRKIAGAAYLAWKSKREAELGFGQSYLEGLSVNRRERTSEGKIILGSNLEGEVDYTLGVIGIKDTSGNPMGALMNYACHPVVLGYDNLLISADYPGYATEMLERIKGERFIAMFTNGATGDINPREALKGFEEARQMGQIIGAESFKVLERMSFTSDIKLDIESKFLELPLSPLPTLEIAERTVEERREELNKLEEEKADKLAQKLAWYKLNWAEQVLELVRSGKRMVKVPFEVQVIALGDTMLVALPGEAFVKLGLEIKEELEQYPTLLIGYANGCIGYIPSPEAYEQGGYEVETSYMFYQMPAVLSPEAWNMIKDTAIHLADKILSKKRA